MAYLTKNIFHNLYSYIVAVVFIFLIEEYLIYYIVLVLCVQQNDTYIFFFRFFSIIGFIRYWI